MHPVRRRAHRDALVLGRPPCRSAAAAPSLEYCFDFFFFLPVAPRRRTRPRRDRRRRPTASRARCCSACAAAAEAASARARSLCMRVDAPKVGRRRLGSRGASGLIGLPCRGRRLEVDGVQVAVGGWMRAASWRDADGCSIAKSHSSGLEARDLEVALVATSSVARVCVGGGPARRSSNSLSSRRCVFAGTYTPERSPLGPTRRSFRSPRSARSCARARARAPWPPPRASSGTRCRATPSAGDAARAVDEHGGAVGARRLDRRVRRGEVLLDVRLLDVAHVAPRVLDARLGDALLERRREHRCTHRGLRCSRSRGRLAASERSPRGHDARQVRSAAASTPSASRRARTGTGTPRGRRRPRQRARLPVLLQRLDDRVRRVSRHASPSTASDVLVPPGFGRRSGERADRVRAADHVLADRVAPHVEECGRARRTASRQERCACMSRLKSVAAVDEDGAAGGGGAAAAMARWWRARPWRDGSSDMVGGARACAPRFYPLRCAPHRQRDAGRRCVEARRQPHRF